MPDGTSPMRPGFDPQTEIWIVYCMTSYSRREIVLFGLYVKLYERDWNFYLLINTSHPTSILCR
jgi:hypothetical protein